MPSGKPSRDERARQIGGKDERADQNADDEDPGVAAMRRDLARQRADARGNLVGGKQNLGRAHSPARAKRTSRSCVPAGGLESRVRKLVALAGLQRRDAGDEGPVIELVLVAIEQRDAHQRHGQFVVRCD